MRVRAIWSGALRLGLLAGLMVGLTGGAMRPAVAQTREGIALQNQILQLQREIQLLEQRGGGYGAPGYPPQGGYPPGGYAQAAPPTAGNDLVPQLLTRVDSLEAAVRDLRGRVEELSNQFQQQASQLGKRIEDLQFQVQNAQAGPGSAPSGERRAPPPPPPVSRPPPAAAGATAPADTTQAPVGGGPRTPELALQQGDAALARHDYAVAEQEAREVLANRASPRAYDGQFLLARALMGQRQYSQAAIAYDDAYNRQKRGSHAPDSLLGLANALTAINEKRAACDTLGKLHTEFPALRADLHDRVAQAGRRAGC